MRGRESHNVGGELTQSVKEGGERFQKVGGELTQNAEGVKEGGERFQKVGGELTQNAEGVKEGGERFQKVGSKQFRGEWVEQWELNEVECQWADKQACFDWPPLQTADL